MRADSAGSGVDASPSADKSASARVVFFGRAASVSFANVALLTFCVQQRDLAPTSRTICGECGEVEITTYLVRDGVLDGLLARARLGLLRPAQLEPELVECSPRSWRAV